MTLLGWGGIFVSSVKAWTLSLFHDLYISVSGLFKLSLISCILFLLHMYLYLCDYVHINGHGSSYFSCFVNSIRKKYGIFNVICQDREISTFFFFFFLITSLQGRRWESSSRVSILSIKKYFEFHGLISWCFPSRKPCCMCSCLCLGKDI